MSYSGPGQEKVAHEWGDVVFARDGEASGAGDAVPLGSGMEVQEAWAEGDKILPVADVLDEQQLAVVGEDSRGFAKELRAASGIADFMRGEEEKDCVAVAIGQRESVEL